MLVWDLTEEDHRDLQSYRPSVYELVAFLRERCLVHALAHPLYRMGPPLTQWHVERMMLLFSVWEGRNGARPEESNLVACRLAASVSSASCRSSPAPQFEATHAGPIRLTGGSDDHGAIDIAETWTSAPGAAGDFLAAMAGGAGEPGGAHGSAVKLAHAMAALAANAYRESATEIPALLRGQLRALFDDDAVDAATRHDEIQASSRALVRAAGEPRPRGRARRLGFSSVGDPPRLGRVRRRARGSLRGLFAPSPRSAHRRPDDREGLLRDAGGPPRAAQSSSPIPMPRRTASPVRCGASPPRAPAAGCR